MSHTYEEAFEASSRYFAGDLLASDVFVGKYALQDLAQNFYELTPDDMHERTSSELHRIEQSYPHPIERCEIRRLLSSWDIVLQGGPMSAIGNTHQVQCLSNCFVIAQPYDSYGGIMKTDEEQSQIMKRRGGVGFDLSRLRPAGFPVANAARSTEGISIFMDRYSNTCREVGQGGRRGAIILTLDVHHPSVLEFANVKRDRRRVTGANVSIKMYDAFINAALNGETYQQRFPVDPGLDKYLIENNVDASSVWKNIVLATRDCSEPGMLFWDTIMRRGPSEAYSSLGYGSVCCNPCGEQPLNAYGSCMLMLVNLINFVVNPYTPKAAFDYVRFSGVVYKAQKLLDDQVDLELEMIDKILAKIVIDPEPEETKRVEAELWQKIKKTLVQTRRTGLGITGLADVFAMLGMPYGSDESVAITGEIYRQMAVSSYTSSIDMARDRGPFPIFSHDLERNNEFINQVLDECPDMLDPYLKHGRRNIANTTTAPAGSTSCVTGTTSGGEALVALEMRRRRKITASDKLARIDEIDEMGDKWQHYQYVHPGVVKWMNVTGEKDITKSPYYGSTTNDIDPMKKIDIQAAAQKWVCSAISNTTTLPEDVTAEAVETLCLHAWRSGCKGFTVYRKGSREAVITDASAHVTHEINNQPTKIVESHAPKRPKELDCDIHRVAIKGEQFIVLVGVMDNKPYEIFAGSSDLIEVPKKAKNGALIKNGKKDGVVTYNLRIPLHDDELVLKDIVKLFDNALHGSFTRTISLALRHGVPVHYVVEQLKKDRYSDITSFSAVIARVLKSYIKDGTEPVGEKKCPVCGGTLVYMEGCVSCSSCIWRKC